MKNTLLTLVLAALTWLSAQAQDNQPVVINGALINWYYQSRDADSGQLVWNEFQPGGDYWQDGEGTWHITPSNRGLFSFSLAPGTPLPLQPTFRIRNRQLYGNCGGLYCGENMYYTFNGVPFEPVTVIIPTDDGDSTYTYVPEGYREIQVVRWTWEGKSSDGTYYNVHSEQIGAIDFEPTDLTYYPEEDIVYGVFKSSEEGYRLATLDMKSLQLNFISTNEMALGRELRTLACDSLGQLYGTDKNGYVYRVSSTDGQLTRLGNMGFKSQDKMMSATFDYRTNRLYWLGFMNNGHNPAATGDDDKELSVAQGGRDTGLYEIDTQTGQATLIGKTNFVNVVYDYDEDGQICDVHGERYGKMQMTGIYVEGSIIKPHYDLKVTMKASPLQMTVGQEARGNVAVSVRNRGTLTMPDSLYSVALYADDQLIGIYEYKSPYSPTRDIASHATVDYYFSYSSPTTIGDKTLRVVIKSMVDERADNNSDAAMVRVLTRDLLAPPIIQGVEDSGNVYLMWTNPRGRITDGAENYMPFSYDGMGPWIMYDGDKGYPLSAGAWNASVDYPNWSIPKAYLVMNPSKAGFGKITGGKRFYPHSGKQYFTAMWTLTPDGSQQMANDDWMISPRLSGMPQTISFWARGVNRTEQIRMLATEAEYNSADDMNYDDWTVIANTFTVSNDEWTEYKVNLPQDYKHFALQCCSQEGFMLMLDDITFNITLKSVAGYRVYRDGRLISVLTSSTTSYVDYNAPKDAHYFVTAIYEEGGESPRSNVYPAIEEEPDPEPEPEEPDPCDINGDGIVDVADIGFIIDTMAYNGIDIKADVNGDGIVDVADIGVVIDRMAGK